MTAKFGHGSFSGFGEQKDVSEADGDLSPEETISNNIQKFSHNVLQIRQLVDNIGTTLDSTELRQRVNLLRTETNALTKTTNLAIKEYTTAGPSSDNNQEWKLKQSLLRNNFHDVLNDYHELQKTAQRKQRATLHKPLRMSAIRGPRESHEPVPEAIARDEMLEQVGDIKAEVDLELVKEREEAITQLESDILDINEIFKDLNTIVHDQGKTITEIEEVMEVVQVDIETGKDQLDEAETNVNKARRKKRYFIMLLCLIVGIATVVVVVILVS